MFSRGFWILTALFCAALLPRATAAGEVSGTGEVTVHVAPTKLRMEIPIQAHGKTPELALERLRARREAVAAKLQALEGEKGAITLGEPSVQRCLTPANPYGPMPGPYSPPANSYEPAGGRSYPVPANPVGTPTGPVGPIPPPPPPAPLPPSSPYRSYSPPGTYGPATGSGVPAQGTPHWESSIDGAKRLAAQSKRLVVVVFSAPWCGPCRAMENEVLGEPSVVAALDANYVLAKLNVDYCRDTAGKYGVSSVPTTIILAPGGQPEVLEVIRGRIPAAEFAARLNQVAAKAKLQSSTIAANIAATWATPPGPPAGPLAPASPVASAPSPADLPLVPAAPSSDSRSTGLLPSWLPSLGASPKATPVESLIADQMKKRLVADQKEREQVTSPTAATAYTTYAVPAYATTTPPVATAASNGPYSNQYDAVVRANAAAASVGSYAPAPPAPSPPVYAAPCAAPAPSAPVAWVSTPGASAATLGPPQIAPSGTSPDVPDFEPPTPAPVRVPTAPAPADRPTAAPAPSPPLVPAPSPGSYGTIPGPAAAPYPAPATYTPAPAPVSSYRADPAPAATPYPAAPSFSSPGSGYGTTPYSTPGSAPYVPSRPLEFYTATVRLTVDWPLDGGTAEKALLAGEAIRKKVLAADLLGGTAAEKLAPDERAMVAVPSGYGVAAPCFPPGCSYATTAPASPYGTPDTPELVYVTTLSSQQRKAALAEAFAKAKSQAADLAEAAGARLGAIVRLSGQVKNPLQQESSEARSALATCWSFDVRVNVLFNLQ